MVVKNYKSMVEYVCYFLLDHVLPYATISDETLSKNLLRLVWFMMYYSIEIGNLRYAESRVMKFQQMYEWNAKNNFMQMNY